MTRDALGADADCLAQSTAQSYPDVRPDRMNRLDDVARAELRYRAADIVRSFRGDPNRKLCNRRAWRWGRKGSLVLNVSGGEQGLWYDHEKGVGGDIIDFLTVELCCPVPDAIAYALSLLGPTWSPVNAKSRPKPEKSEPDDSQKTERAVKIWSSVSPLRGTPAEQYLIKRGIAVPEAAFDVLGFTHWEDRLSPRSTTVVRRAAILALVQDVVTQEPISVRVRELTRNAEAAGSWLSLGPTTNGVIRLSEPTDGELTIGEGLETCLSGMLLGYGPAWSVISAGGMTNFPVLDYIDCLTILVDHDESGTGQRAANACCQRWISAGKRVRRIMPEAPGHDMNDLLLMQSANSLRHE
ncbi:toprim domain-containing protein [Bradyrhizobium tropiciagri]|uniref:toprim domain-containing protein n=1 Tax=Bradyrhizobium tropiciagri TaxID=312253 RepID=UPI001BAB442C|nr:toprim domain-containing protein [Bradyrhizobium tropiciagri]MBR0900977.1 toprim domain-containing protein [Bradyrhizobium tropiciagri]